MTTIDWLKYHRESDLMSDRDRVLERVRHITSGHGKPDVAKHSLRVFLVLRDLDGDGAREIGHRRLNATQIAAVAKLNQRSRVEPPHRDAASSRFLDDRGRRGTKPHLLV